MHDEFEDELRRLADSITPDTNFAVNLEQALLKGQKEKKMLRLSRGLGFAAGLGMLVALTLAVPPLRTLAQEIIDSLFNQLDSDTTSYTYTVVDPPQMDDAIRMNFETVAEAEQEWSFNILQPAYVPEGYQLNEVFTYNTNGKMYAHQAFDRALGDGFFARLYVQQSSFALDWGEAGTVGASAELIPVEIQWGDQIIQGEYVEGGWVQERRVRDLETNEVTVTKKWMADIPMRTMRWRLGNTLFVLNAAGHPPETPGYLGQEEMVKIAESMYADSLAWGGGMYYAIADAQTATGIDLPELPDLTEEYQLERLIVLPDPLYIQFWYKGDRRSMTITRSVEDQSTSNDVGESAKIIPVMLNWNGHEITAEYIEGGWMEKSRSENGEKVRQNLKWDSELPFQTLRWQDDGIIYEIASSHSVHQSGLELSELTRVAESMYMEDVAFEGSFFTTIADAEAAFSMDIPEPEGIPCYYCLKRVTADGQSFELVYADGYELLVSRKLSHFAWRSATDIGASAEIMPVQLQWGSRTISAEYVSGGWVVAGGGEPKITKTEDTETRELDWENDLPIQSLRWQEGNFRYEVYVKGGSPDHNWVSREAMIEIAESLY